MHIIHACISMKMMSRIDLIHAALHLCTLFRIDGIKARPHGISGGKQVIKLIDPFKVNGAIFPWVQNYWGERVARQMAT